MVNWVPGCYEACVSAEGMEFWTKLGMPEEMAKGMVGGKMSMEVKCLGGNTLYGKSSMEGFPEMDLSWIAKEGQECEFSMPGFGKIKMTWKCAGENKLDVCETFEKLGTVQYKMTHCEKGSEWVYTSKEQGHSYTQHWNRVIDMDGTFRLCGKMEGAEDFPMMMEGFSMKMLEDPSFKYCIKVCEDGFMSVDYIGGQKYPTKAKWGEERQNPHDKNISDVHVKVGVGAIKSVSKHTDGRIQETEWTYSPCGNKVDFVAKDLKSGKCCKMSFEKFCDFSGSYKIISRSGLEEFCKVTGTNVQEAKDFYSHPTTAFTFKELGNFCESDMVHKGASVLKLGFNYNEEFATKYPMMGDKPWSVVVTKNGCTMSLISKGEKCTIKSVMKRTKNFLLFCDEVCGTGVKTVMILVPTDC